MTSLIQKVHQKMKDKIVNFKYVNQNYFKIENEDRLFLEQIYNFFSVYVPGYKFMPYYQSGYWDGQIHYFDKLRQILPLGLIQEAQRYILKLHRNKSILVDSELKSILYNKELEDIDSSLFTLKLKPQSHQIQAIRKCLYYKRAVIRSPTASGKSYSITCIMNYLHENKEIYNCLLIVPTIQLVEQFRKDMISYGIPEEKIGVIHGSVKDKPEEFMKTFTISTWQSLCVKKKNKIELKWEKFLKEFDGVVVDECHLSDAKEIRRVIMACTNAKYRLGFTGTLPDNTAELYGILAFIGPKVLDIQTTDLIREGVVSDLVINSIEFEYKNKIQFENLTWQEVKQKVIQDSRRLELIKYICEQSEKNTLILVTFVETEGLIVKKYLEENLPDKEIHFIHGSVDINTREDIRTSAEFKKNMIIIATYGVFKLGINIKNLHRIIFASPLAAKIATLQSIGRGLRVLPDKKLSVFDIIDKVRFLQRHGNQRKKYWKQEKFHVKNFQL